MTTYFEMKTMDAIGYVVALVVVVFLAGVGVGGNFSDGETAKDCQELGKFRAAEQTFECRALK